jgi:hypothetical protein
MSRLTELYRPYTSQGASAQVLLYGATVVSWKSPSSSEGGVPQERLFVSSKSALDGSKPVSCFESRPCARPESRSRSEEEFLWSSRSSALLHVLRIPSWLSMGSPVPQSGSGRTSIPPPLTGAASNLAYLWITKQVFRLVLVRAIALSVPRSELGVLTFSVLEPIEAISKIWPYNFKLAYVVTLAAHQLSTDLHVLNQSGQHIDFQALLHTYYAVNAATTKVTPLTGLTYLNKVNGGVEETEQRQEVDVTSFTDSVYKDAVSKSAGKYKITDGSVSSNCTPGASRTSSFGTPVKKPAVRWGIWNPVDGQ